MNFVLTNTSSLTGIIDSVEGSLFTYGVGESWGAFYSPTFVPSYEAVFLDDTLEEQANQLCGNDQFCLFDVAATERLDIGLTTLEGSENVELVIQLSLPG